MPRLKTREYEELKAKWLEQRLTGIGASDASSILGINPWKSALALYTEKVGIAAPNVSESEIMEWGHRLEAPIAEAYEDETGRTVFDPGDFEIQRHRTLGFMMATLDRVVLDVTKDPPKKPLPTPGDGVLEIKTTGAFNADEWEDEPPLFYQVQVQHQLAVTGLAWGSLAVLIGGQQFRWIDLKRNDAFIEKLIQAEDEFWWRVKNLNPPPPDNTKSSADALAILFPKETEDTIALPGEFSEADAAIVEANDLIKKAEATILDAQNKLKAAIGVHAFAFLPNGVRYSWKQQTRPSFTAPETTFRVLRRKAPKGAK